MLTKYQLAQSNRIGKICIDAPGIYFGERISIILTCGLRHCKAAYATPVSLQHLSPLVERLFLYTGSLVDRD